MKKKMSIFIATTALASLMAMPAFATENLLLGEAVPSGVSSADVELRGTSPIKVDNGGFGEWGYGILNMWGKFYHTTAEHAVVLTRDGGVFTGPWELAGSTVSYLEMAKGDSMDASGSIR